MNNKVVLILPAYNASSTLRSFLNRLPKNIFAEIILVDDCSTDGSYELAKKQKGLSVFQTPQNLGYGGNLKFCLGCALEYGADIIIELHPDGEYDIDGIKPAIQKIGKGAKLVLGERKNLLSSGFPLWKYPFVKLSNFIDNLILGSLIVDLHQGFRVYSRELLEKVNFRAGSNNYIFSFEIIAQAIFHHLRIETIPVTVRYQGKKRGASLKSSIIYTLDTFKVLFWLILARVGIKNRLFIKPGVDAICPNCNLSYEVEERLKINRYSLFFCKICQNGFLQPVPKNLSKYYPSCYWNYEGAIEKLREIIFNFFQLRRKVWVEKYLPRGGEILDVGSGEGDFAKSVNDRYRVTSLEAPFAKVKNNQVLKQDFLTWKTKQKFQAIVFWESLEHISNPKNYLEKARQHLVPGGYLFIEYPRFNCLEAKLLDKRWFHLDIPRHLFHFTDQGLGFIIKQLGFKKVTQKKVFSLDYAPWGLVASLVKKDHLLYHPLIFILLMPLAVVAALVEGLFFVIGESPIGLVVAQKE